MLDMAERKKRPGGGDPAPKTPKRSGEPLNVWIRADLMDAIRALVSRARPRTTKTALVEEALEDLITKYRSLLDN